MSGGWEPISTAPRGKEVLVCVTYNLPDDEWETAMWTDYHCAGRWVRWIGRIDIPVPPTHWMPLPDRPEETGRAAGDSGRGIGRGNERPGQTQTHNHKQHLSPVAEPFQ